MFGFVTKKVFSEYQQRWDRQFEKLISASDATIDKVKVHCLTQDKIHAKSNQIKHNGLDRRLTALETVLEHKLKKWHENNERKEIEAAQSAEDTYSEPLGSADEG